MALLGITTDSLAIRRFLGITVEALRNHSLREFLLHKLLIRGTHGSRRAPRKPLAPKAPEAPGLESTKDTSPAVVRLGFRLEGFWLWLGWAGLLAWGWLGLGLAWVWLRLGSGAGLRP